MFYLGYVHGGLAPVDHCLFLDICSSGVKIRGCKVLVQGRIFDSHRLFFVVSYIMYSTGAYGSAALFESMNHTHVIIL